MHSRNCSRPRLLALSVLLVFMGACKETKRSASRGDTSDSELESRYSFQVHLSHGNHAFDIFTEGNGSLRAMTVIHAENDVADTVTGEIDGAVVSAACADLDRDSLPEIYIFAQSAGSGSYAKLFAFEIDRRGRESIVLPDLDKRLAAGYLGHDTLWVRDTVLVRRFPVYTEADFNVSASGGTRTLEYVLQHNRDGGPFLQCVRIVNDP